MGVAECVAPENIHTPGGHFCFRPPHPPGISIPEGACHTPPPPLLAWNFRKFYIGWVPSGKDSVKNVVALYHYAKDNFSAIKREKFFSFMLIRV